MNQILSDSATAQARLVREGQITSAELLRLHRERIERINPALNAVVELLQPQPARSASAGPLAGVPFSIKDSIEVEGTVCTAGTLGRKGAAPSTEDAELVARLRRAGAIPIARTNLPDLLFAFESDNLLYRCAPTIPTT